MKIRSGFVSNSSSSSFIISFGKQKVWSSFPGKRAKAYMTKVIKLLKSGATLVNRSDDYGVWKWNSYNNKIEHYGGCCDYCYGVMSDYTEKEFREEMWDCKFELMDSSK